MFHLIMLLFKWDITSCYIKINFIFSSTIVQYKRFFN